MGGIEVTIVEEPAVTAIPLPASFPDPAAGPPQMSDATLAAIEAVAREKIGPKAEGLAEAMRALPPEALKLLPVDALQALAAM